MALRKKPQMGERSYRQILKSTTIIGGSSAFSIVFRILASKVAALIIGPSGIGLIGLFNSATGLVGSIAGAGLANSSGVRRIAEAVSSGDEIRIAKTTLVLKRISLILGLVGSVVFFVLRVPISQLTFGSELYASPLGFLSIAICLTVVSGMQSAFLRGARRVSDIARANVYGIALGTFLGLPALYFFGQAGIAPYLLIMSAIILLVSWWYVRKIQVPKVIVSWHETFVEARGMLGLGVAFMLSGLTTLITTYLVKVIITRQMGLEAAGLYEAASVLANVYVGFILGAMGTDFFPHLTVVSHDNVQSSELMNAQVEIGLLVATPGILSILALGAFLLQLLYSAEFMPAFEILRWQVLGTFLRVISWPLGYIILAKGKGNWFFWSEFSTNLVYLGSISVGVKLLGLAGIGTAFFVMYIFHTILMIILSRRLADFHLAKRNLVLMSIFFPLLLLAFGLSGWQFSVIVIVINLVLVLVVGAFSIRSICILVGPEVVREYLQRFRNK